MSYSYFALRGQARYIVQPNRTRVMIHGSEKGFLDKEDVAHVLPIDLTDTTTISVDLSEIENRIRQEIPYAKGVNAYISPATRQMTVEVESRKPTLRFFSDQGSFYLDDEGNPMRTKVGVSVYLPIVRAHQVDSLTLQQTLLPLSQFMQSHEEWDCTSIHELGTMYLRCWERAIWRRTWRRYLPSTINCATSGGTSLPTGQTLLFGADCLQATP